MLEPYVRSSVSVGTVSVDVPSHPHGPTGESTARLAYAATTYWCAMKLPSRFDANILSAKHVLLRHLPIRVDLRFGDVGVWGILGSPKNPVCSFPSRPSCSAFREALLCVASHAVKNAFEK